MLIYTSTVKALSARTYICLCCGLASAAHHAYDSYIPLDQVNVMENSLQSIGSLTQNLLPEEAKC